MEPAASTRTKNVPRHPPRLKLVEVVTSRREVTKEECGIAAGVDPRMPCGGPNRGRGTAGVTSYSITAK